MDLRARLIPLAAVALLLAGCNKQRSDLAIAKAEGTLRFAETYAADRNLPNETAALREQVEEAKQLRQAKKFKDALVMAQDAVRDSKDLLIKAKEAQVNSLDRRLRSLDAAAMRRIDPMAYDEAFELMNQIDANRNKSLPRGNSPDPFLDEVNHLDRLLGRLEAQTTGSAAAASPGTE